MRPKMHVVMLLAVAIATVFALANQVSALANSNESGNPDESVMLHVVPDLYDQKADAEDDDYFKVGSAAEECEQLGFPFGFK